MEEACKEYSVMVTIFSFLPVKQLLSSAALVCKTWHTFSQDSLLWQKLVIRDCEQFGQRKLKEGQDWQDVWKSYHGRRKFDPKRSHNVLNFSEDYHTVNCNMDGQARSNGEEWLLAMTRGVMRPNDGVIYYCEYLVETNCSNLMLGAAIKDADPYAKYTGWGFKGSYMTMAHSINLCCGVSDYQTDGWTDSNGRIVAGDRVGIIVDTRPPEDKLIIITIRTEEEQEKENEREREKEKEKEKAKDKGGLDIGDDKGADIYFAVNGKVRPVAFKGIKEPLSFCVSIYVTQTATVTVVNNPTRPRLPNE